jgi:cation diffusion facilitator family transporter
MVCCEKGMPLKDLYRKGLYLEYFTIGYNLVEATASIVFGALAGSIALIGFGLDSIVESLSGLALIWRLKQHGRISRQKEEMVERRAMRFVAITFFILAAYILYESVSKLVYGEIPEASLPGMVIAVLSLIVMPALAWMKNDTGKRIGSRALVADAKETQACAFLSLALLLGLGLNYLFGFWQADPIAGMVIVLFLLREAYKVWEEAGEADEEEREDSPEVTGS